MKMGKMLAYGLAVMACLYVFAPKATAQYRASIQGSISDTQGNTVADAKVTVKSNETVVTKGAYSHSSGPYSIHGVAPGRARYRNPRQSCRWSLLLKRRSHSTLP